MFSSLQSQALIPVIQHYIGGKIINLRTDGEKTVFSTLFGEIGELVESPLGDWKILIGEEEVDFIEKEVFNILVKPDKKGTLENYIKNLTGVLVSAEIKYRSKLLVSRTLKVLEEYIINSDFVPNELMSLGTFCIYGYQNQKFIYCLN